MPYVRLGDRTQLHLFLTTVEPLLNRRAFRKQIKATTRVASLSLGTRMRALMLVLLDYDRYPNDAWDIINAKHHGRSADETDQFPAFSQNINYAEYPTGFNPANMQNLKKCDGKQYPRQWLRIYSTAIEVAGGTNSTKVIYFPMALESAPLTWLESLRHDSIHSWEDLKKIFIDNFQGSIHRPATRHDLRLCK